MRMFLIGNADMSVHHDPPFDGQRPDNKLPGKLAAAVAQAHGRHPTSDMVAQLVARASRLGDDPQVAPTPRRSMALRVAACVTAAAAMITVVFALAHRTRDPAPVPDRSIASADTFPVYSAVTTLPLVEAGFGQIEADLQRAESHLDSALEAVALAAVRRDVRATLEEYPRWGH